MRSQAIAADKGIDGAVSVGEALAKEERVVQAIPMGGSRVQNPCLLFGIERAMAVCRSDGERCGCRGGQKRGIPL